MNSIDQLIKHLSSEQRAIILELERIGGEVQKRGRDAKTKLEKMDSSEEKIEVERILKKISDDLMKKINALPTYEKPLFNMVSGAPGSGKSKKSLETTETDAIYMCGDEIKKIFISLVKESKILSKFKEYQDANFIHRITSDVNWKLFDYAISQKKNVTLEMLGTDPKADSELLKTLHDYGYEVRVHHVATTTNKAINNAINRYFDVSEENTDSGRFISLTGIANKQKLILDSFLEMSKLVGDCPCEFSLYDNADFEMKRVANWQGDSIPVIAVKTIKDMQVVENGSKLWFKGENHAVDMVVLSGSLDDPMVAVIKRGQEPFKDFWALPGGFVNSASQVGEEFRLGAETHEEAALRELSEETLLPKECLDLKSIEKIGVFSDKLRDPRNEDDNYVVSTAFMVMSNGDEHILCANDDAKEAKWLPVKDVLYGNCNLAFDHEKILHEAFLKLHHKKDMHDVVDNISKIIRVAQEESKSKNKLNVGI